MKTQYRIENIEDAYGSIEYFLTYLLITKRFFGLVTNEHWVTIPLATDGRAVGAEPLIRKDCICESTIGVLKQFTTNYPDVNTYLNDEYIPKMNELIDKWAEIKADDEDTFDNLLEAKGFAFIS